MKRVVTTRPLGGEMELDLSELFGRARPPVPIPAGVRVDSGRSAIRLALTRMPPRARRVALLPDYLCGAIIQPFREERWRVAFYPVSEKLRIQEEALAAQVARHAPSLLLFINYFGFPVTRSERVALSALRRSHGLCLLEDCVHGSLVEFKNPALGDVGDFVVTSFRKYTSAPDGGLLRAQGLARVNVKGAPGPPARLRLLAKLCRGEVLGMGGYHPERERMYLDLFAEAERQLCESSAVAPLSAWSHAVLQHQRWALAAARRRANFRFLLKAFGRDARLRRLAVPVYDALPSRVAPLAFPICVRAPHRRDALRAALGRRRIYAAVHWPLPGDVPPEHTAAHALAARELSLPLDQRYGVQEMEYLVAALRQAGREIA